MSADRGTSGRSLVRSVAHTRSVHQVPGGSERRFGVTVNGRIHGELRRRRGAAPVENEIAGLLDRLDGRRRFSAMLWALPPGLPFEKVPLDRLPVHFIQAAGTRDRMTVETRFDDGGTDVQAVVRKSETAASEPSEVIEWDSISTPVFDVDCSPQRRQCLSSWRIGNWAGSQGATFYAGSTCSRSAPHIGGSGP